MQLHVVLLSLGLHALPEKYSVFNASELVRISDVGTVPIRMVNPSSQPVKI